MSHRNTPSAPASPDTGAEQTKKDATNPNSHGVGTLVIRKDGDTQSVRIAYFPEALAYYNAGERRRQ